MCDTKSCLLHQDKICMQRPTERGFEASVCQTIAIAKVMGWGIFVSYFNIIVLYVPGQDVQEDDQLYRNVNWYYPNSINYHTIQFNSIVFSVWHCYTHAHLPIN